MAAVDYEPLSILVIDDFESFRVTVCNMLTEFGCEQVSTEINGRRGIQLCEDRFFDVVLCDYNLGSGANGQQVLETLRETKILKRQSLFILISAETSKSIVLSAYDYEPDAYLSKPITPKSLKQRLDRLLKQRQELLPIYQALDDGNKNRAIEVAQQRIVSGSRYSSVCHKLLGELYIEQGLLDEAEHIYNTVIQVRELDWAKVGLAKVQALRGNLSAAIDSLSSLLQVNPFCMHAYDALADNYRQQGNLDKMQDVLQSAVNVSPMSIIRQTALAQTANQNRNFDVASKAFGRAVRLGEFSYHDKLENHVQYARTTAELLRHQSAGTSDEARDALSVIDQLDKRFDVGSEARTSTQLIEVQLQLARGEQRKARELYQKVMLKLEEEPPSLDVQLDRVATLASMGERDAQSRLLKTLLEEYADDQEALRKIDIWLDEPSSDHNSKYIAKINNEGINFYKNKEFTPAIENFTKLARLFPQHLGVRLNLVQVLIADMKESGVNEEKMDQCVSAMHIVEKHLRPNHPQFQRYQQLRQGVRLLG